MVFIYHAVMAQIILPAIQRLRLCHSIIWFSIICIPILIICITYPIWTYNKICKNSARFFSGYTWFSVNKLKMSDYKSCTICSFSWGPLKYNLCNLSQNKCQLLYIIYNRFIWCVNGTKIKPPTHCYTLFYTTGLHLRIWGILKNNTL